MSQTQWVNITDAYVGENGLRRLTPRSVFAKNCCHEVVVIKKCRNLFHFRVILHIKFIISASVDMIYDIKYYHLCIHTGLQ